MNKPMDGKDKRRQHAEQGQEQKRGGNKVAMVAAFAPPKDNSQPGQGDQGGSKAATEEVSGSHSYSVRW